MTPKYEVGVSGGQGAVVGDYARVFQIFTTAPQPLAAHIRIAEFESTIEDRTASFTGRDFVFAAIDKALQDDDFRSGYIVLQGEPGIGKTAVLARLIKNRAYVHHLNIGPMGIRSPEAFLTNVCAQLVVRYRLDHAFLPEAATRDGGFLSRLLTEAARDLASHPVVVVVDALDEAEDGAATRTNRLFLPPSLPTGVFFVISTRERADYQLAVHSRRDIYLRDDDPQNLDDITAYVHGFLRRHDITADDLADTLVERSEGNFMYVVHVLRDIQRGVLDLAETRELPQGLRAYYQQHWNMMRTTNGELFDRYQEPVVCLLATAREPVTLDQIAEWTRQYWRQARWDTTGFRASTLRDVVRDWQEFLNFEVVGAQTWYRVYHSSFQDFLRDEIGLGPYHAAIKATALAKIPDFFTDP